jgi:tetratricopeptide (TPR) repeat protein
MRGIILPALVGMATIWGASVSICPSEQVQQLIDSCGTNSTALPAIEGIKACTALMQSGGVFGQGLSWAFENRCSAYVDNKQFDLAVADCNRAIEFVPTTRAYVNRGNAFYARGDNDQAIADYNRR